MIEIPDYLLSQKPELKFKKNRQSQNYRDNINVIINWLIKVDEYISDKEFEEFLSRSTSEDNIQQFRTFLELRANSLSQELIELFLKCREFNPALSQRDFLKMLNLDSKPKRGRPVGKTSETSDLDFGVYYYRRLRMLLNAEYGVEARDALLTRISNDLYISKSKLEVHLVRPQSRVSIGKSI